MAFTKDKKLQHVKPHGAMYNMAVKDERLARAICRAALEVDPDMILVVLAGSPWAGIAQEMGVRVALEAFADRALNPDGTLVPRSQPGAVIHDPDEVTRRSIQMVTRGTTTAINGEEVPIQADTLCLHGDTPGAVELAARLRAELEQAGAEIAPMGSFL